jgi:Asp-tRNA(Asn)/Glu-tRNA(Gln) amidotransferase B subunit
MSFTKRMNEAIVDAVLEQNPTQVAEYKNAPKNRKMPKRNVLGYLCGQAMRMSEGMCDPTVMRNMFKAELD